MNRAETGLEVGRRRVLHPGPLRWLRALGWMTLLAAVLGSLQVGLGRLFRVLAPGAGPVLSMLLLVSLIALLFGLYALLVRFGEDRAPRELAPDRLLPDLLLGAAVGTGMFCAVMAALVASGAYRLYGPSAASAWRDAYMALGSGFLEELLMRAIVFRLAMRALGVWPALALSAALFGALHLMNANATLFAAACIAVEAGLSLAALYLATGNLWAPIGFHVAWNFVQAYVFGARVSGLDMGAGVWTSAVNAGSPVWLSGGPFGPEASAPALVFGAMVALAALHAARRRGRLHVLPDLGK